MTDLTPFSLHGTLVRVNQVGILLQGKHSSGKSDSALALLHNGHQFIADDRVELYLKQQQLYGAASNIGQKMLFIHGIGLINCSKLFNEEQLPEESTVDLVITLDQSPPANYSLDQIQSTVIAEQTIAHITLPACKQRPLPNLIETAASCFLLKKKGYNAAKQFDQQLRNSMGLD